MTRLTILRNETESTRLQRLHVDDLRTALDPDAAMSLQMALKRQIDGEVRFDKGTRALYATDGSNYRQVRRDGKQLHQKSNVRVSVVNMPALNTTQFIWTKNKMAHKARPTGTIFQPEVASDAILFAAEHDRREIMVGYTTVEATLGEKVIPGRLDHYLAKAAWEGSMLPEPVDPDQPDNFWEPLSGDHGSHGEFDDMARNFSVQLWATKHRKALLAGLFVAGAGLATALLTSDGAFRQDGGG